MLILHDGNSCIPCVEGTLKELDIFLESHSSPVSIITNDWRTVAYENLINQKGWRAYEDRLIPYHDSKLMMHLCDSLNINYMRPAFIQDPARLAQ